MRTEEDFIREGDDQTKGSDFNSELRKLNKHMIDNYVVLPKPRTPNPDSEWFRTKRQQRNICVSDSYPFMLKLNKKWDVSKLITFSLLKFQSFKKSNFTTFRVRCRWPGSSNGPWHSLLYSCSLQHRICNEYESRTARRTCWALLTRWPTRPSLRRCISCNQVQAVSSKWTPRTLLCSPAQQGFHSCQCSTQIQLQGHWSKALLKRCQTRGTSLQVWKQAALRSAARWTPRWLPFRTQFSMLYVKVLSVASSEP